MRILILGGYGLIGLAIAARLHAAGHTVTGLGRRAGLGVKLLPRVNWLSADIATLQTPENWRPYLANIDIVINAAGALQEGPADHLTLIHETAIVALLRCCEADGVSGFIQISAPGATREASTAFMRSKAGADSAIKASPLNWIILRPGLVIGNNAYGGSALLRMLAAVPIIQPLALAEKRIQTVALSDVTLMVQLFVEKKLAPRVDLDLVEDESHTLADVVSHFRSWLGIPPAWAHISAPRWAVYAVAAVADGLGYLGWRSPLRSTAMRALEAEIIGDPKPLRSLRNVSLTGLADTLAAMPATVQERWFARLYLLLPIAVATLSVFWLATGFIALFDIERAAAVLANTPVSKSMAQALVVGGAALDIILGGAILYRPWAKSACVGMIVLTLAYLVSGTLLTAALWLDPLGPFVKVLPSMVLALTVASILENR